jgi:hypothetical protein
MKRATPGMALVLTLFLPLLTGCARRPEGPRHEPPPAKDTTAVPEEAPAASDAFGEFLAELLLDGDNEADTPPAEPVPDVTDLPPLPREYFPPAS